MCFCFPFFLTKEKSIRCFYDVKLQKLFSRSKKEILGLTHIVDEFEALIASSKPWFHSVRFIDGEIYSHGLHFQNITSIARRIVRKKKIIIILITTHILKGKQTYGSGIVTIPCV